VTPPLVVFDLDGTLIDSKRDLADATNALIAERGGAALAEDRIAGMVGEGAALLVRRALQAAGLDPESPGALPRFLELYDERLLVHTSLYDGIPEALAALAPRVQMSVLTNKPTRATERIVSGLGLRGCFRDVIGGDTPCGRKPDPAGLVTLMSRAGVTPATTWLVGDSRIDFLTARNAGVRVCLARYGFGYRFAPEDFDGSEVFIDAPSDLTGTLNISAKVDSAASLHCPPFRKC
jgi:phosphoglycolate phosphatase